MNLELHIVTYTRIFFGHFHVTFPYKDVFSFFGPCRVIFPYKEVLSFFGHCQVRFPYMEPLSFVGRFVQKVRVSCFSDSFVQKTTQQSNGSCNVTSISQLLYKLFKKQPLCFCKHS